MQDDDENRTTAATLRRLYNHGSLDASDFRALDEGYALLRAVDHQLRLIVGRSARLPAPEHQAFGDIALRLGYATAEELSQELKTKMAEIRAAYERITHGDGSQQK